MDDDNVDNNTTTTNEEKIVIIRKTYSPQNAQRFVAIFDYAIEHFGKQGDMFIPCSKILDYRTGNALKANTARHRMGEALGYLMQYELDGLIKGKYKCEDYARLRVSIRLLIGTKGIHGEGVIISFKHNCGGLSNEDARTKLANEILTISKDSIVDENKNNSEGNTSESGVPLWQELVNNFLDDNTKQVLILTGQKQLGGLLTVENIDYVKRVALQSNIEYEVTSTMIKLAK